MMEGLTVTEVKACTMGSLLSWTCPILAIAAAARWADDELLPLTSNLRWPPKDLSTDDGVEEEEEEEAVRKIVVVGVGM